LTTQDEIEEKYRSLKKKIDELKFISTGSVMKVFIKCGKPSCICHRDKTKRHGPYNIWTRKVDSKTVTRTLNDEQTKLVKKCVGNMREFEEISRQMKVLSVQYIENYKKSRLKGDKN